MRWIAALFLVIALIGFGLGMALVGWGCLALAVLCLLPEKWRDAVMGKKIDG